MHSYLPLISRALLAVIFVVSGISKIQSMEGATQYMLAYGVPLTNVALIIAIVIELGGGLLLLSGWKARQVAGVLAGFLMIVTLIFHTGFSDQMQVMAFLKNIAIIGGLLMIVSYEAGDWILKKKNKISNGI